MKKFKPKRWLPAGGVSIPASKQEETKPVEWVIPKLYKPERKKKLPTLESIVKQRIVAGIASYPEAIAYLKDCLWEKSGLEAVKSDCLPNSSRQQKRSSFSANPLQFRYCRGEQGSYHCSSQPTASLSIPKLRETPTLAPELQLFICVFSTSIAEWFRSSEHPRWQFRRCNEQALPHPLDVARPHFIPSYCSHIF